MRTLALWYAKWYPGNLLVHGCHEAEPTNAQLDEIRKLEEKLGVVLVAVRS